MALEMGCLSLYGSSVRGTMREGSITGGPEGYKKVGSGEGHLSPYGPTGEPGEGIHFNRDFVRQYKR
jgi:hypothetical protein